MHNRHLRARLVFLGVLTIAFSLSLSVAGAQATGLSYPSFTDYGGGNETPVLGDVDGDGALDVVVGAPSSRISVRLGNGDGTLGLRADYPTGAGAAVALGDLNGDGDLDAAAAGGNGVAVLLGNGDGTFAAHTNFGSSAAGAIALSDLDGDGQLDVVTTGRNAATNTSTVSVLLGNGDGTLGARAEFAVADRPLSIAVGDLNRDQRPDVVTTGSTYECSCVSVLLGIGDGALAPHVKFSTASAPFGTDALALGDLNEDGNLDLGVATYSVGPYTSDISILLGKGDGTFMDRTDWQTCCSNLPESLTIADLDGDGHLDVVAPGGSRSDSSIFLGNGFGGYTSRLHFHTGNSSGSVAVGDLDGNGVGDFVLGSNFCCKGTRVALGQIDPPPPPTIAGSAPASPADDNSPIIFGLAEYPSTVRLYTSSNCAGEPVAEDYVAHFSSPGFQVSVPDDSTTTFTATATVSPGRASACSVPFVYVEDSTPPRTTITSGPTGRTRDRTPTFKFRSSEPTTTFSCRVDGRAYKRCTSPYKVVKLSFGRHTFWVEATDLARQTERTPARAEFNVVPR